MATVSYDDRSLLLDGRRIWLVSGSIHYFRTPQALWADRLLKAKQAGLNCVSTAVAWNFHEAREGQWDFTGDRDIAAFVRLAGELGLYVILKPGPYIGSEWDFGGLPGWLGARTGMAYRTTNASFTHYFDKYFRQILPRLAEQQVTRDGSIILIQNECEYLATTAPDRLAYLEFINQLFRRGGFDVPIIDSNLMSDPAVVGNIECASGWSRVIQDLKRLRRRQAKAPLFVSPLRSGSPDCWGRAHERRDDAEVARTALEVLGCGGQADYTPWQGGTNFGFWGARTSLDRFACATTSYDCDAPVAEGGGLTRKYYLCRLVNLLASSMGGFLAHCTMDGPGFSIHDGTHVLNLSGAAGRWAVVTNGGRADLKKARLSTPSGDDLNVSLEPFGAVAIPVELNLTPTVRLDYANLMPLGLFGGKVLVFHGPAGWDGCVSLNGSRLQCTVPEGEQVRLEKFQDLLLVFVNSDLAMRTWVTGEALVFGPLFVGRTPEEIVERPQSKEYTVLPFEGELTRRRAGEASHKPAPLRLTPWRRQLVCMEPVADDLEWQKIDRPADADRLGVTTGYLWYRLEFRQDKPLRRNLLFPDCEDRAIVYVNGSLLGTWGRGPGATREPVSASLRRGTNVVTLLVDNLGHFSDEPNLGQLKGLFGHVYDAKPLPGTGFKKKAYEGFSRRMVPRALVHLAPELESTPAWSLELPISLSKVAPIHLSFAGLPHHVAVLCNDRQAKFFPRTASGTNFGDVTLGSELRQGKNLLRLLVWGDVAADVAKKVCLHSLVENLSLEAAWSMRRWEPPQVLGRIVGKNMPAWYVAHFKYAGAEQPLFLKIYAAHKGQVFLNGHNVGRFWNIGPQEFYYLPSCWLREENELMIFEEEGLIPAESVLEFRPLGPYGEGGLSGAREKAARASRP